MPINPEGVYESLSFMYQHETDETFVLKIEYHHTEMGPTITIHNLLDSGPLALPLSVFVDTVDHLRSRGSIPGGAGVQKLAAGVARPATGRLQPTRIASPTGGVQRPQSVSQKETSPSELLYAPQHAVLTADGAVDVAGNSHKSGSSLPKTPVHEDHIPIDIFNPTQEFDGEMTLEAGKARRAAGQGRKGLKPAGKPKNIPMLPPDDPDIQVE